jgi:hypothetical protein
MKEVFQLSGLTAKETKDGDTEITFKLSTTVGPGFMATIYNKLQPLNNQQVISEIKATQTSINLETGEV